MNTQTSELIAKHSKNVHLSKRKYICKYRKCSKKFATKGGLQLHCKTHFPDRFLLKCFECDFTSFQKGNLEKHLAIVHQKSLDGKNKSLDFACNLCHHNFITEGKLKSHIERKHTDVSERQFKCQLCSYTAVEKSDLQKHIRMLHTGDRPYECEFCSYKSHTASGLARHHRSHTNTKPFQCSICPSSFADKKRLDAHLMKHSNIKPFSCPNCPYATNRKDNLKLHIRRSHTDTSGISLKISSALSSTSPKSLDPVDETNSETSASIINGLTQITTEVNPYLEIQDELFFNDYSTHNGF